MPQLQDLASVRQDQLLTSIALAFREENRIADLVMPALSVSQEDGQYSVFGKEAFNIPDAHRRPKKQYKEIDWTLTKASYHAEEYGLEMRIDDRERRAADRRSRRPTAARSSSCRWCSRLRARRP